MTLKFNIQLFTMSGLIVSCSANTPLSRVVVDSGTPAARPRPGDLDASFGDNGIKRLAIRHYSRYPNQRLPHRVDKICACVTHRRLLVRG